MKFFSGFSLINESYLFNEYLDGSDYTVCGFSYGAIKALRHTKKTLALGKRIDTLQLFSPAFFQSKPSKFKRMQMLSYNKNKDGYLRQFINSCFLPYEKMIVEHTQTSSDELEELLNYEWMIDELKVLVDNGLKIEVYLGGEDKIIDVNSAKEFFLKVATVTYIKNANHFLQVK